jgi:hypothetical protein
VIPSLGSTVPLVHSSALAVYSGPMIATVLYCDEYMLCCMWYHESIYAYSMYLI